MPPVASRAPQGSAETDRKNRVGSDWLEQRVRASICLTCQGTVVP